MKPAPEILPPSRSFDQPRTARPTHPQVDYSYQSTVAAAVPALVKIEKQRAELNSFRALSREFLGVEAARESLKEGLFFACIMAVAAWPLSTTLNQLGTMMISPPPWVIG
jgi:hypothetical protein